MKKVKNAMLQLKVLSKENIDYHSIVLSLEKEKQGV